MNVIELLNKTCQPVGNYCVWYITSSEGWALDDITEGVQINQEMMVVRADSAAEALQVAEELLKERCLYEFFITKVADREHLEFVLSVPLARVERGELPPASLADASHYVWSDRYVKCSEVPKGTGNTP